MLLLLLFLLFPKTLYSFNFRSVQSYAYIGPISQTIVDIDWLSCLELCALRKGCDAYNYKKNAAEDGICELIDNGAHVEDECSLKNSLIYENGTTFHQVRMTIEVTSSKEYCYENTTREVDTSDCPEGVRLIQASLYVNASTVFKDCAEALKAGRKQSGVYTINPDDKGVFEVFCDQSTEGGAWIVFQKRFNGTVDFYQNWTSYRNGFGNLSGEFWLGLDKIHRLTSAMSGTVLRVDLGDFKNNSAYAEYDLFKVGNEQEGFGLQLGSYSGTSGDSLTWHKNMLFSTYDQNNGDCPSDNCAVVYHGAWWYADSYESNLNGRYYLPQSSLSFDGVIWMKWNEGVSLKRTEMKMRSWPRKN